MSKKVVLEEEQYVEALGQIIERDFFPDLPGLKRQTEVLRDGDESRTETDTLLRGASARGTPSVQSNAGGMGWDQATERSVNLGLELDAKHADRDGTNASMTLGRFVATYTSEDNESFNELQEKAVRDHRRQYHWAYDEDEEKGDPKLHLLTDGTWISKEQRQLVDESCAPKGIKDERPSAPETWVFRARNALLFPPDVAGVQDLCKVPAGSEEQLLLENGPDSRVRQPPKARKKIVYANSRFPTEDVHLRAAKNGAMLPSSRKDYSLVPMTPLIAPGVHGSPLMTWGEIEGTPAVLEALPVRNLQTPSFELQETSRREKLANRLESEARRRNLDSRMPGIKTPSRKRPEFDRTSVSRSVRARVSSIRSTPVGSDVQLRASYSTPSRPPRHFSKTQKRNDKRC